ncbi:MAG: mannose-1-phosphate guanylyltransferase [Algisphaera sp.]
MRYALIIAGGSGTRLWPMSVKGLPKQLIPFIESDAQGAGGRSLLQEAVQRLEGLLPAEQVYVCAGAATRDIMLDKLPGLTAERFIAEPIGRDTLNAVGLGCAAIHAKDPDAVVAVFTADHLIEPQDELRKIVDHGFALAESGPRTLVTFGIAPTHPATGYGYLQLGKAINGHEALTVDKIKEKPAAAVASTYHAAGPSKFLWNSGMFVWRASAVMEAIARFAPENHAGLTQIANAWGTPTQDAVLNDVFPTLHKISVDFAVMEPASADPDFTVAAVPMPLSWLDVGSWPSFGETLTPDAQGHAASGGQAIHLDSKNILTANDQPGHLITTIGCEDLIVIHTAKATLVCRADQAERIKELHARVGEEAGNEYL